MLLWNYDLSVSTPHVTLTDTTNKKMLKHEHEKTKYVPFVLQKQQISIQKTFQFIITVNGSSHWYETANMFLI
jgi:hypothetical protein